MYALGLDSPAFHYYARHAEVSPLWVERRAFSGQLNGALLSFFICKCMNLFIGFKQGNPCNKKPAEADGNVADNLNWKIKDLDDN